VDANDNILRFIPIMYVTLILVYACHSFTQVCAYNLWLHCTVFIILPCNGEFISVYIIHLNVFDTCKENVVSEHSEDGESDCFVASSQSAALYFVTETQKTIHSLEVLNLLTLPDEIFYWGFCFLNHAFS
jgi:hypothetical protein